MARLEKFWWLLIVVAGVAAYGNSFTGVFVFDDHLAIRDNLTIRQFATALAPPAPSPVAGRPVVNLSLALNYAISGLEPWSYRVFNLVAHLAAGLVLFGIVRRTCGRLESGEGEAGRARQGAPTILGAAVALLWVVHPLQTESVMYVTQRTELLAGLCLLVTLYCVTRSVGSPVARRWELAAVGACAVGAGCKEIVAVTPVLVLLYDRLFLAGSYREAWRARRDLYLGLMLSWVVVVVFLLSGPRGGAVSLQFAELSPAAYARTQLGVIAHYLRLAFWPQPLVADYHDWPVAAGIPPAGWLVVALLAATGWGVWRGHRWSFLGAVFFLVLAPSSSFIPIITELAAERRMYVPLAAVIAGVVFATRRWAIWWVAPVAVAFAALTFQRNEVYRSAQAFWSDAAAKRPGNGRAQTNLANALMAAGKPGEALAHYQRALELAPGLAEVQNNAGYAAWLSGDAATAARHFAEALRLNPGFAVAHVNLARVLAEAGQWAAACDHQARAVQLRPDVTAWRSAWAACLAESGDVTAAIREWRECVRREPRVADWRYRLAVALLTTGDRAGAKVELERAVELNPQHEEARAELAKLQ